MLAKLNTFALVGIDAVQVEVDNSFASMPRSVLVGLPEASVRESIHRIERALCNLGYQLPDGRTVINLAPERMSEDAGSQGPVPAARDGQQSGPGRRAAPDHGPITRRTSRVATAPTPSLVREAKICDLMTCGRTAKRLVCCRRRGCNFGGQESTPDLLGDMPPGTVCLGPSLSMNAGHVSVADRSTQWMPAYPRRSR